MRYWVFRRQTALQSFFTTAIALATASVAAHPVSAAASGDQLPSIESVATNSFPETLHVCVTDHGVPPLAYPDHDGTAQAMIRQIISQLGGRVNFIVEPRRRSIASAENGHCQALLLATYSSELKSMLAFPMHEGKIDERRALVHTAAYILKRKGTSVAWDGQKMSYFGDSVLILAGNSMVRERLKKMEISYTEPMNYVQLGQMLLRGRADAAIVRDGDWNELMKDSEMRSKIERIEIPFGSAEMYFAFNSDFAKDYPAYVEAVWNEIAIARSRSAVR